VPQAVAPQPSFVPAEPGRKDSGLAWLFSFLWLGTGHLYIGDERYTGTGIALVVVGAVLFLLSLTGILLILTFPAWIALFIWAGNDAASKVRQHNALLGLQ
jgi:TM2 domain-containing membrane protein YozV